AAERQVLACDRERDDDAGAEAVADVGVALDEDRGRDHHGGPEQQPRNAFGQQRHQALPRRSSAITPKTATRMTVISTSVSSPRKSARITVTTSAPCADGVSRRCSEIT